MAQEPVAPAPSPAPPTPAAAAPAPAPAVTSAPAPAPSIPTANLVPPGTIGGLPDHTTVLAQKAATAFGEQKWEEARAAYEEMLKLDENNALAWANLGAVEQQAGKTAVALECFEKAVQINPKLAQSWSALGLIYSSEGDTYRAISCFTRAIHEEPTDARAHNYLAIAAKNLGWIDAAQNELQRAIELNPQYGIANFNLALLYLDQKPPAIELAKRHYEKAVSLGVEKDEIVERRLKE
ncbi:tetratricopeptide repeat protein [Prosthecobacter fusiformis]|uniref:Tetratricopeptide repeat protein n=1 Tax=Prosthecobacter fusiformis TaxID=48464 RepID=A0A4R7SSC9_9BACT|nr:tetratricopeptide repeat protein [Prosthecobacter fusiformis]TDU81655.1 tetratricopeptide repeat protein [Prosthecobacter fusiformis]